MRAMSVSESRDCVERTDLFCWRVSKLKERLHMREINRVLALRPRLRLRNSEQAD